MSDDTARPDPAEAEAEAYGARIARLADVLAEMENRGGNDWTFADQARYVDEHLPADALSAPVEAGATEPTSRQWAAWFRESADQADDLDPAQASGFRIAADHLENRDIAAKVARIWFGDAGAPAKPDSGRPDRDSLLAVAHLISRAWATAQARQGGAGGSLRVALDALDELLALSEEGAPAEPTVSLDDLVMTPEEVQAAFPAAPAEPPDARPRLVAEQDGKGGCPVEVWDGPYRMRCSLGRDVCGTHGRFAVRPAGGAQAEPTGDIEPLTFEQFEVLVRRAHAAHPGWRLGQTYVNVAHTFLADLLEPIEAAHADYFYRDDMIPGFRAALLAALSGSVPSQPAPTEESTP